ncbi:MAG TPA: preprotein translocase subunit SecG [Rhodospirillales bacterium]|nr:preprotein translocase subunit SecG [Rhodospirillales bacterium]
MITVILVFHLLVAIALVGVVLLQRSEGGGLGMGGGGGAGGGLMSGRETANLLTRATGILAAIFMSTSLLLGILASSPNKTGSIMEQPAKIEQPAVPAEPKAPIAN